MTFYLFVLFESPPKSNAHTEIDDTLHTRANEWVDEWTNDRTNDKLLTADIRWVILIVCKTTTTALGKNTLKNRWMEILDRLLLTIQNKKNSFVCRLLPSKCCCRCCCSNNHSITQNKLRISTIRFRFRFTFEIDTRFYFYPTASFSRSLTVRCQLNDRPTVWMEWIKTVVDIFVSIYLKTI